MNKPSWISPREFLESWLINTVYHLLSKNNKEEGRWGGGCLLTFFPWKEGALIEDLGYDGQANTGSYWLAMSEINAKTITAVKDVTHWSATRRPAKNSALPGLEPWLLQYWCSALTKWATKTTGSWLLNWFVYRPEKWRWNNEYMNC